MRNVIERNILMKSFSLLMTKLTILVALPFLLTLNIAQADNSFSKEEEREYIIQADDWLSNLVHQGVNKSVDRLFFA